MSPSSPLEACPIKEIPNKPYPELKAILEEFIAEVRAALTDNFIGAYLAGSLATGDFDLDSDVDFLIVTSDELTGMQLRSLQNVHTRIHGKPHYTAQHLEGSYFSKDLQRRSDLVGKETTWFLQQSWDEREGVRFCIKIRQSASVELLKETLSFVRYAIHAGYSQYDHFSKMRT